MATRIATYHSVTMANISALPIAPLPESKHIKALQILTETTKHFEYAITLAKNANVFCEYGHFLYQQANMLVPCNNILLEHAIPYLKQAIILPQNSNGLNYGNLEKIGVETYLQQLITIGGQISIIPSCLAYYLLIRAEFILGHHLEAIQTLYAFERHVVCMFKLVDDAINYLKIELLLLEKSKQFMTARTNGKLKYLTDIAISDEFFKHPLRSELMTFSMFRKLNDDYITEHRHESPRIQRAYDDRFGLVVRP